MYSVYIHLFPNGKTYVGVTQQEPQKRWKYGAGYRKQPYINNAIKKYGWANVKHIVLFSGMSKEDAEAKEKELITLLKSNNRQFGYNVANGGNTSGKFSEETKQKLSKMRIGMQFSDEHKRNLSKSHKGIIPSKEQNQKNMINNPRRKPVLCIETGIKYDSIRDAGRKTGINHKRIAEVCNRAYGHKSAGGFSWKYVDEERA